MGLPVSHGCFSSSRTSSILSKDHPPDKKPKSDKTSLPSNEFDPTGNFPLFLFSLLLLFCSSYSLFFFYTLSHTLFPLFHLASVCITLSDCLISVSLTHSFCLSLSFSFSNTHTHTHTNSLMKQLCWWWFAWCTRHAGMVNGGVWILLYVLLFHWQLYIHIICVVSSKTMVEPNNLFWTRVGIFLSELFT